MEVSLQDELREELKEALGTCVQCHKLLVGFRAVSILTKIPLSSVHRFFKGSNVDGQTLDKVYKYIKQTPVVKQRCEECLRRANLEVKVQFRYQLHIRLSRPSQTKLNKLAERLGLNLSGTVTYLIDKEPL